jgi:hypothetical protein
MAKKEKTAVALPKVEDVPRLKPLVDLIARREKRVEATKAAATAEGAVNKADPKYREARKRLKRGQRRLKRELIFAGSQPKKAVAPAPVAPVAEPAPAAEAAPAPAAEETPAAE